MQRLCFASAALFELEMLRLSSGGIHAWFGLSYQVAGRLAKFVYLRRH